MTDREATFSYFTFKNNNGSLLNKAFARRSWWKDICYDNEQEIIAKYRTDQATVSTPIEASALRKQKSRDILEQHKAAFTAQEFNFCWSHTLEVMSGSDGRSVTLHSPDGPSSKKQLVNHFPNLRTLTTKTGLIDSLLAYAPRSKIHIFDITPTTFIVKSSHTGGSGSSDSRSPTKRRRDSGEASIDTTWSAFLVRYRDIEKGRFSREMVPEYHCSRNMWIVKPSSLNCGRGIHVFQDLSDIKKFITFEKGEYVIQKYLEQPLLLWGRKFDMRIWVAVTQDGKFYIYRNGYLRTSSEKFTLELKGASFTDKQMTHLTNYCMQKNSENIGKFEDGNTLSFDQFQKYLDEFHASSGVDVREHIFSRIKIGVVDSLLSSFKDLNTGCKAGRNAFELFGFDFMVDRDFRVWLIEVNTNPYLGVQNTWHGALVQKMVDDLVSIVVDPLFPAPASASTASVDTDNGFELLYDHAVSGGAPPMPGPRPETWYYPVGKTAVEKDELSARPESSLPLPLVSSASEPEESSTPAKLPVPPRIPKLMTSETRSRHKKPDLSVAVSNEKIVAPIKAKSTPTASTVAVSIAGGDDSGSTGSDPADRKPGKLPAGSIPTGAKESCAWAIARLNSLQGLAAAGDACAPEGPADGAADALTKSDRDLDKSLGQSSNMLEEATRVLVKLSADTRHLEMLQRGGCVKSMWGLLLHTSSFEMTASAMSRAVMVLGRLYDYSIHSTARSTYSLPVPDWCDVLEALVTPTVLKSFYDSKVKSPRPASTMLPLETTDTNSKVLAAEEKATVDESLSPKHEQLLSCFALQLIDVQLVHNRAKFLSGSTDGTSRLNEIILAATLVMRFGDAKSQKGAENLLNRIKIMELMEACKAERCSFLHNDMLARLVPYMEESVEQKKLKRKHVTAQRSERKSLGHKSSMTAGDSSTTTMQIQRKFVEFSSKVEEDRKGLAKRLESKKMKDSEAKARDMEVQMKLDNDRKQQREMEAERMRKDLLRRARMDNLKKKISIEEESMRAERIKEERRAKNDKHMDLWLQQKKRVKKRSNSLTDAGEDADGGMEEKVEAFAPLDVKGETNALAADDERGESLVT